MYLLDTNVLSEIRKPPRRAHPSVVAWTKSRDRDLAYISVISLLEIEVGALRLKRRDVVQGQILLDWLNGLRERYRNRKLVVDDRVAAACAPMHVPDPRSYQDALIAATALVHDLTVATRNVKDFEPLGVRVFDPWDYEVSAT